MKTDRHKLNRMQTLKHNHSMTKIGYIKLIHACFYIFFSEKAVAVQSIFPDPSNEGQRQEEKKTERRGDSIYTFRDESAADRNARKDLEILDWADLRGDFLLTNSDDGRPKPLTPFYLILFETSGNLSTTALIHIEQAVDSFLFPELNVLQSLDNPVASIITEVEGQEQTQTQLQQDRLMRRRDLQYVAGSRLRLNVNVTFDREPSPPDALIDDNVIDIMQNLTYFLTNLSALRDPELERVTNAYRQELSSVEENPIILEDSRAQNRPSNNSMSFMIPILCGLAVMVAVTVMLVLRRRRRIVEEANKKVEQDLAFLDEESNLFSFENSPVRHHRKAVPMEDGDFVVTEDNSVFDGLESGSQMTDGSRSRYDDNHNPSSSNIVYSPTSLTSHNTMFSGSTIKASNARVSNPMSPSSRFGGENSLFAFSEEEEGAGDDSESDSKEEETGLLRRNNSGNVSEPSAEESSVEEETMMLSQAGDPLSPILSESQASTSVEDTVSEKKTTPLSVHSTPSVGMNTPGDTGIALGSPPTDGTVGGSTTSNDTTFINLSPQSRYSCTPTSFATKRNSVSRTPLKNDTPLSIMSNRNSGTKSPSENTTASSARESVSSSRGSQSQEPSGAFPRKYRRHTKSTTQDGTTAYQTNTMQPQDWSMTDGLSDDESLSDVGGNTPSFGAFPQSALHSPTNINSANKSTSRDPDLLNPTSPATNSIALGHMSTDSISRPETDASSPASASRQLINDLVWLSKKIAGVRQSAGTPNSAAVAATPPNLETADSLSYASQDASFSQPATPSSMFANQITPSAHPQGAKNIVCRDCFAPPGKLSIVIHSTKDGPAVHEVKEGSSLEGHIFPGDLIISVDNVDTRSYTAAQLMKMMTEKARSERKITVLHFEYDT